MRLGYFWPCNLAAWISLWISPAWISDLASTPKKTAPECGAAKWCRVVVGLSDLGGPLRPLLLLLLALLLLFQFLRLLLLANVDQHLAHRRSDLALDAFAAQLALVGQVVEVGEALGVLGIFPSKVT